MPYSAFEIISVMLNLLFGGGIIAMLTIKSQRKKAFAEAQGAEASAESTELDNMEKAVKIWRETAEAFKQEVAESRAKYEEIVAQVNELKKSIDRLNSTNAKILRLLDKMSPSNFEKMVTEIRNELEHART
jgi:chromosome segregation ATPase